MREDATEGASSAAIAGRAAVSAAAPPRRLWVGVSSGTGVRRSRERARRRRRDAGQNRIHRDCIRYPRTLPAGSCAPGARHPASVGAHEGGRGSASLWAVRTARARPLWLPGRGRSPTKHACAFARTCALQTTTRLEMQRAGRAGALARPVEQHTSVARTISGPSTPHAATHAPRQASRMLEQVSKHQHHQLTHLRRPWRACLPLPSSASGKCATSRTVSLLRA